MAAWPDLRCAQRDVRQPRRDLDRPHPEHSTGEGQAQRTHRSWTGFAIPARQHQLSGPTTAAICARARHHRSPRRPAAPVPRRCGGSSTPPFRRPSGGGAYVRPGCSPPLLRTRGMYGVTDGTVLDRACRRWSDGFASHARRVLDPPAETLGELGTVAYVSAARHNRERPRLAPPPGCSGASLPHPHQGTGRWAVAASLPRWSSTFPRPLLAFLGIPCTHPCRQARWAQWPVQPASPLRRPRALRQWDGLQVAPDGGAAARVACLPADRRPAALRCQDWVAQHGPWYRGWATRAVTISASQRRRSAAAQEPTAAWDQADPSRSKTPLAAGH